MLLRRSSRVAIRASHEGASDGLGAAGVTAGGLGAGEGAADCATRWSFRGRWSIGIAGAGRRAEGGATRRAADIAAAHGGGDNVLGTRADGDGLDDAGRPEEEPSSGVRQYRRLSANVDLSPRSRRGCASQTTLNAAPWRPGTSRRTALSFGSCPQRSSRTKRLTSVPPTWGRRCQCAAAASRSAGREVMTR